METRIRSPTAYQKRKPQSRSLDKTKKERREGRISDVFGLLLMKIAAFFVSVGKMLYKNGVRKSGPQQINMAFFVSAIDTLKVLVTALGAGLGVWGVINLLEGYGNDNPGANAHVW